ncbi:hypothetical protein ACVWYQ_002981 [Bradyrhizobium sp. USDA 3397]
MTRLPRGAKVHAALDFIDMRKGLDDLAMLVPGVLRHDPFTGSDGVDPLGDRLLLITTGSAATSGPSPILKTCSSACPNGHPH